MVRCQTDPCLNNKIAALQTNLEALTPLSVAVFVDTVPLTVAPNSTVVFDGIDRNPDNIYNSATGEFTITQAGLYLISATLCANSFTVGPPSTFGVAITVNGLLGASTNAAKSSHVIGGGLLIESESVKWEVELAVGDVVRIVYFGNGSADILSVAPPAALSFASLRLIAS